MDHTEASNELEEEYAGLQLLKEKIEAARQLLNADRERLLAENLTFKSEALSLADERDVKRLGAKARKLIRRMGTNDVECATYRARVLAWRALSDHYRAELEAWRIRSAVLTKAMFSPALH